MKILSLEQFLACPPGVLFSKYDPCVFEEIHIKGDSYCNQPGFADSIDFIACPLTNAVDSASDTEFITILSNAVDTGGSVKLDLEDWCRDGYFERDQLYAVYEKEDVEALSKRLLGLLETYPVALPERKG